MQTLSDAYAALRLYQTLAIDQQAAYDYNNGGLAGTYQHRHVLEEEAQRAGLCFHFETRSATWTLALLEDEDTEE